MTLRQPISLPSTRFFIRHARTQPPSQRFSTLPGRQNAASDSKSNENDKPQEKQDDPNEDGAMTRRLAEMTEQAVLEGGRSTRKNISNAGFSEELKKELEERVAAAEFKNEHPAAHSIINMPVYHPLVSVKI